jgi:hypothetical protein
MSVKKFAFSLAFVWAVSDTSTADANMVGCNCTDTATNVTELVRISADCCPKVIEIAGRVLRLAEGSSACSVAGRLGAASFWCGTLGWPFYMGWNVAKTWRSGSWRGATPMFAPFSLVLSNSIVALGGRLSQLQSWNTAGYCLGVATAVLAAGQVSWDAYKRWRAREESTIDKAYRRVRLTFKQLDRGQIVELLKLEIKNSEISAEELGLDGLLDSGSQGEE